MCPPALCYKTPQVLLETQQRLCRAKHSPGDWGGKLHALPRWERRAFRRKIKQIDKSTKHLLAQAL